MVRTMNKFLSFIERQEAFLGAAHDDSLRVESFTKMPDNHGNIVEYIYSVDSANALLNCIVLRCRNCLYKFSSGTFVENEEQNNEEYFRFTGAVVPYKKVICTYGEGSVREVMDPFVNFLKNQYNVGNSSCSVTMRDEKKVTIRWSYQPQEWDDSELRMISGILFFKFHSKP